MSETKPKLIDPLPFGLTAPFITREMTRVGKARADAERQAWSSLARYKFWMFGYHAAQWVLLNRMLDVKQRRPNPFRDVVRVARGRFAQIEQEPSDAR